MCQRCDRHLRRTLNRVKRNVLGSKLAQIGSRGLRALDLHVAVVAKVNSARKRQTIMNICLITVSLLSIIGLLKMSQSIQINKNKLDNVFSPVGTSVILWALARLVAAKILIVNLVTYIARLPYISHCCGALSTLIAAAYAFVTGNVIDYVANHTAHSFDGIIDDISGGVGPQPTESNSNDMAMLNLSGCMLSTVVICTQGIRFGSVLSLLLWSVSMALPSVFQRTAGPQIDLIVDFVSIFTTLSIVLISGWNLLTKDVMPKASDGDNSSFHRIADNQSDVSDESEAETELNLSQQSVYSNRSIYGAKSTMQILDKSLNLSNASASPSIFSSVSKNNFMTSSEMSLNHMASQHELNKTYTKSGPNDTLWETSTQRNGMPMKNMFTSQQSLLSDFTSVSQRMPDRTSHRRSDPNHFVPLTFAASPADASMQRCASRASCYDVPDEFQSGITTLSIGTTRQRMEHAKKLNPSLFVRNGPSTSGNGHVRQRRHLLQPPKLNYVDNQPRIVAANQASWVTGGYWNHTSPQKRQNNVPHTSVYGSMKASMFPMVSRTSSQSSGFESHCSSPKQTVDNNSNDNSISDEIDRESNCSELATYLTQPAQRVSEWQQRNGAMLANHPLTNGYDEYNHGTDAVAGQSSDTHMSHPLFSAIEKPPATPHVLMRPQTSFSCYNSQGMSSTNAFETSGFSPLPLASSSMHQPRIPSNLTKFDRNMPTAFRPGSLLRLSLSNIEEKSMTDH